MQGGWTYTHTHTRQIPLQGSGTVRKRQKIKRCLRGFPSRGCKFEGGGGSVPCINQRNPRVRSRKWPRQFHGRLAFFGSFCWKTHMPIKFLVLGGVLGFFRGVEVPILFLCAWGFFRIKKGPKNRKNEVKLRTPLCHPLKHSMKRPGSRGFKKLSEFGQSSLQRYESSPNTCFTVLRCTQRGGG